MARLLPGRNTTPATDSAAPSPTTGERGCVCACVCVCVCACVPLGGRGAAESGDRTAVWWPLALTPNCCAWCCQVLLLNKAVAPASDAASLTPPAPAPAVCCDILRRCSTRRRAKDAKKLGGAGGGGVGGSPLASPFGRWAMSAQSPAHHKRRRTHTHTHTHTYTYTRNADVRVLGDVQREEGRPWPRQKRHGGVKWRRQHGNNKGFRCCRPTRHTHGHTRHTHTLTK